MHRVSGAFADHQEVVALSYSNGSAKLNLFEQSGALDHDSVEDFEPAEMGGSDVWVRDGEPMLVTWDDDGVVYTIVTNADRARVERGGVRAAAWHAPGDTGRARRRWARPDDGLARRGLASF